MCSLDCTFWIVCIHSLPLPCLTHIMHLSSRNISSMVVYMFPNKAEQRTRLIGCSVIWSLGTISGFILFVRSPSPNTSLMMSATQRWRSVSRALAVDLPLSSMRRRWRRTSRMDTHTSRYSPKLVVDYGKGPLEVAFGTTQAVRPVRRLLDCERAPALQSGLDQ